MKKVFIVISILAVLGLGFLFMVYQQRQSHHHALRLTSRSLSEHKVFIFDFDGTICDSFEAAMRAFQEHSESLAHRKLDSQELEAIRNMSMQDLMQSLGISRLRLPFVVSGIRKSLNASIDSVRPFKGIREAILKLKTKGYGTGVLTSNSEENVLQFCKKNDLLEAFDFIYSGGSLFGKDRIIKGLLADLKLPADQVIYVGDEARDIDAAKTAGVPIIAVSWGFNSRKLLEAHRPDFLIDSVAELEKF